MASDDRGGGRGPEFDRMRVASALRDLVIAAVDGTPDARLRAMDDLSLAESKLVAGTLVGLLVRTARARGVDDEALLRSAAAAFEAGVDFEVEQAMRELGDDERE